MKTKLLEKGSFFPLLLPFILSPPPYRLLLVLVLVLVLLLLLLLPSFSPSTRSFSPFFLSPFFSFFPSSPSSPFPFLSFFFFIFSLPCPVPSMLLFFRGLGVRLYSGSYGAGNDGGAPQAMKKASRRRKRGVGCPLSVPAFFLNTRGKENMHTGAQEWGFGRSAAAQHPPAVTRHRLLEKRADIMRVIKEGACMRRARPFKACARLFASAWDRRYVRSFRPVCGGPSDLGLTDRLAYNGFYTRLPYPSRAPRAHL